jgi:hypothetical protein
MSELVDPSEIETIVGATRHPTDHIGRADSSTQTVYILHSQECRDSGIDLRECPFSIALDRGIEEWFPWTGWRRLQDQPVRLELARDYLMPAFDEYRAAVNARCTSCGEPLDSLPCQRDPLTGRGGHLTGGGMAKGTDQ